MRQFLAASFVSCTILLAIATPAWSQTSLTGSSLVFKSAGSPTLSQTGYVGTYLTVPAGGATVNFDVNATGTATPVI